MTLKKIKILDTFLIFGFSYLVHYLYMWFPNTLFSIFFPVNQSLWEHMKMLFTAILMVTIFDYFIFKRWHIENNNFLTSAFLSSSLSVPIFLFLHLIFDRQFGYLMYVNLGILIFVIILSQVISYYVLQNKYLKHLGYYSLIGIIIAYIILGFLTYYPPENNMFFDKTNNKYGINHYVV